MAKETKIVYSDNDRAIVNALKGTEGLTLSEMNANGLEIKPGHIVSAMKKGLIAKIGEREVMRPAKRKVSTYVFVTADALTNGDKAFNYTDNERKVLSAAGSIEGEFTLAELATAMGLEKLSSGSINGLVKKGNISKGEQREVIYDSKTTVGVYGFVADIPNE